MTVEAPDKTRQTISLTVRDVAGALARIVGLVCRRGVNITSLTTNATIQPGLYKVIFQVDTDAAGAEQIVKQVNKLIDVIKVVNLAEAPCAEAEVALVNIHCSQRTRSEILKAAEILDAKILDASKDHLILRLVGRAEEIRTGLETLMPYGIIEVARGGTVALKAGR